MKKKKTTDGDREPQKHGTEERNTILENFFPKAIIHSIYYLPFSPSKGYTLQANPLHVCSHIHSLDTLSFLQHIVANSIYQTLLPTTQEGYHSRSGVPAAPGKTGAGKRPGSLTPFPATHRHFHQGFGPFQKVPLPLSGIMANPHAPCSPRGGRLPVAAHSLFGMTLSPLPSLTNPVFCSKVSIHNA